MHMCHLTPIQVHTAYKALSVCMSLKWLSEAMCKRKVVQKVESRFENNTCIHTQWFKLLFKEITQQMCFPLFRTVVFVWTVLRCKKQKPAVGNTAPPHLMKYSRTKQEERANLKIKMQFWVTKCWITLYKWFFPHRFIQPLDWSMCKHG